MTKGRMLHGFGTDKEGPKYQKLSRRLMYMSPKADDRYGNGIRKLSFRQEHIAGNDTLESIIHTWVAFPVDPSDMKDTVARQCVTVDPPTLSKPGISYQVVKNIWYKCTTF